MISCAKYADAWPGFFGLFRKFWPDCPFESYLLVDDSNVGKQDWPVFSAGKGASWCATVKAFASLCSAPFNEPVMLLQDDFYLNAPVNQGLILHALEQMKSSNAGMVRLYPCPGADEDYGDPYFGIVKRGSRYRISAQCSIWQPEYLYSIASRFDTPQEFELQGTPFADSLSQEVLAFKREVEPWPLSYIATAIVSGKWDPNAKTLCDQHGIQVDFSKRGFQAA